MRAVITECKGYRVVDLGVAHPYYCGIMEPLNDDDNIAKVIEGTFQILDRSFIWLCDRELNDAKYVYTFPGMSLDLAKLKEPKQIHATFEVISSEELSDWAEIVAPTYDFTEDEIATLVKLYKGKAGFYHMVAKVNNIAVGVGTLQVHGDVAILHNICTLPKARGNGIGSKMAFELLILAKQKGCTQSLIHGSAKAETLYQRLGYKTEKIFYANFFEMHPVEES